MAKIRKFEDISQYLYPLFMIVYTQQQQKIKRSVEKHNYSRSCLAV